MRRKSSSEVSLISLPMNIKSGIRKYPDAKLSVPMNSKKLQHSRKRMTKEEKRRRSQKLREAADGDQKYKVRQQIVENGRIICPAFSVPPLAYRSDGGSSDSEDYGELN